MTDYQIGIFSMEHFIAEYSSEGRWVRQQRLALTREEKIKILSAIDENNKEETALTATISSLTTVLPEPVI